MERLFVILTFECVMCFHSNTGDKICEVLCDKVVQRGDLYGLENICEVLCCKGQFQDHKGCPAPGAGGGGTPLQEANRDVPRDGVALSRLE